MHRAIKQTIEAVTSRGKKDEEPGGFIDDIASIRERARRHIGMGAVTDSYKADRYAVVSLLNDALATELVCILRYKRHYFMAEGLKAQAAADEFLEHANEEQRADDLASLLEGADGSAG